MNVFLRIIFLPIFPPIFPILPRIIQIHQKQHILLVDDSSLPTRGDQYAIQRVIQNTVRVPASLYMQNLRALTSYQAPSLLHQGVYWQQSSDRAFRHIQKVTVPTRGNSLRSSITRFDRPGCATPGGAGVDMKHGSYQRYLNRLMAKGPMKREPVPKTFGVPVPFNPAFPIYGNKTLKTNIINKCVCIPIPTTI